MPVPSPDEKRGGKIQFILNWFLLGNAYLDLFIFLRIKFIKRYLLSMIIMSMIIILKYDYLEYDYLEYLISPD
jgi:hypothetical protein